MAASGADAWQTVILNVGIGQKFPLQHEGLFVYLEQEWT